MHRQACSKGHLASQAPWQLPLSPPVPWVLSLTLTFNRNKHLEDKPFVVVCFFLCLFLLFQNLPCLGTGECFRCCAAGAMLALGLLPPLLGLSRTRPPPLPLLQPLRAPAQPGSFSLSHRSGCKVKKYETQALVLDVCAQVGGRAAAGAGWHKENSPK